VFINNGIESLIRIFGDIVDHLARSNGYNPRQIPPSVLFNDARYYLDPMIDGLAVLDTAQGKEPRPVTGPALEPSTGGGCNSRSVLRDQISTRPA